MTTWYKQNRWFLLYFTQIPHCLPFLSNSATKYEYLMIRPSPSVADLQLILHSCWWWAFSSLPQNNGHQFYFGGGGVGPLIFSSPVIRSEWSMKIALCFDVWEIDWLVRRRAPPKLVDRVVSGFYGFLIAPIAGGRPSGLPWNIIQSTKRAVWHKRHRRAITRDHPQKTKVTVPELVLAANCVRGSVPFEPASVIDDKRTRRDVAINQRSTSIHIDR